MKHTTTRRKTRQVRIGTVAIGGANPVAIQSMTKTPTRDAAATIRQIRKLADCGCSIVRCAVKDQADAEALKKIKVGSPIPVVADIHFDWRLAMSAIESGVDKIRLNPGNIFKKEQVREVAAAAKERGIPIRVGVNSGSFPAKRMVAGALTYIRMLERFGFHDIVISLKASGIQDTVAAYRKMSALVDYPLHVGVTATGAPYEGALKSSVAIGALLLDGIGDTIRVSLTADPLEEVRAARAILSATGRLATGAQIISCPTCGRCEVDLISLVKQLEHKLSGLPAEPRRGPLNVALMGCVVNGPGEAREADLGIAFGKKEGLLFKKGKAIRKVTAKEAVNTLYALVKNFYSHS